jgi:hypothetical protein
VKRILPFGLMLILGSVSAHASEVTFSPSPGVAGQPITVTFQGVSAGCGQEGTLELQSIGGNQISLLVNPANCPVIPIGIEEYTASTTIGPLPAGTYFVAVRDAETNSLYSYERLDVKGVPACNATETSLCLGGSRFAVTGEWTDFEGNEGVARAVPDDFDGLGNYGTFWFFAPDNPEMVVKVIDACSFNGYYWVFLSPASTVKYDITVRDVRNNIQKTYSNAAGNVPALTADTSAFPCALGAP